MSDQVWYYYQNQKQFGPYSHLQLGDLIKEKTVKDDSYLFKVGWKDWRPIEECGDELALPGSLKHFVPPAPERRYGAPRATIRGTVVVHNKNKLSIGMGVNVSPTGIFVETTEHLFSEGEELRLTVRAKGLRKSFNATAKVIRFNADDKFPVGYGLVFVSLRTEIADDIQQLVNTQNLAQHAGTAGSMSQ